MSGSSDRRELRNNATADREVIRGSDADVPVKAVRKPKSPKSVGRTHQILSFLFLGLAVLAFGISYYFGLIHLPD
jgi:hypothetical protein